MKSTRTRLFLAHLMVAAIALSGCGGGGSETPGGGAEQPPGGGSAETPGGGAETPGGGATPGATTEQITFWDPYPQRTAGSEWDQHVLGCAPEGSTIVRTSMPQNDLFNQLTTGVREGTAPDVALLDNPMMPAAVEAGLLAPADEAGINTTGIDANLMGPGIVNGVAYGVPFGSNALGLYYNAEILDAAGVDPASITDWNSLNAALEKISATGKTAITFAGVPGEEGVFQFLPWFWGAGADLSDLTTDNAIAAGQLLSDWVGKGWAPRSVTSDNQSAAWDLFLTGDVGFVENGSWFAGDAANNPFKTGVIPIPARNGGAAPVPTGGEFAVAPIHQDNAASRYANAAAVIACLTSDANAATTNELLGYLSAKAPARAQQVADNPIWEPWVSAIENAKGRTTDLGGEYPNVSAQLSEALQGALNAAGDANAVRSAFENAAGF